MMEWKRGETDRLAVLLITCALSFVCPFGAAQRKTGELARWQLNRTGHILDSSPQSLWIARHTFFDLPK